MCYIGAEFIDIVLLMFKKSSLTINLYRHQLLVTDQYHIKFNIVWGPSWL